MRPRGHQQHSSLCLSAHYYTRRQRPWTSTTFLTLPVSTLLHREAETIDVLRYSAFWLASHDGSFGRLGEGGYSVVSIPNAVDYSGDLNRDHSHSFVVNGTISRCYHRKLEWCDKSNSCTSGVDTISFSCRGMVLPVECTWLLAHSDLVSSYICVCVS